MSKSVYRLQHAWTLRFMNPIVDALHPKFPKQAEALWAWYTVHVIRPQEVIIDE